MKIKLSRILIITLIFSFAFTGFAKTLSTKQLALYQTKLQSATDLNLKIKYYKILIIDAKKKKTIGIELQYRSDLAELYQTNNHSSKFQLSNLFSLGVGFYKQSQWQDSIKHFTQLSFKLGDKKTKLKLLSLQYLSNIFRKTGNTQNEEKFHHQYLLLAIPAMKASAVSKNYQHLIKLSTINKSNKQHQYFKEWHNQIENKSGNDPSLKPLLIKWVNYASKSENQYLPEPFELLEAYFKKGDQVEALEKLRILYAQKTPDTQKRLQLCQLVYQLNPSTNKWVLAQLFKNTQNTEEQKKEIAILQQWLKKETNSEERKKVYIKLIKLSILLKDRDLELKYRQGLHQELENLQSKELLLSRNYYQIANLIYARNNIDSASTHYKNFLELEAEMKANDINQSYYHLYLISKKHNDLNQSEFYLSKYLSAVNQVTSYNETTSLHEDLISLSTQNSSPQLHKFYFQWFQKAKDSGTIISQHNILVKWINYALSDTGKIGDLKQNVNEMPFDLLIDLQVQQEKWDETNQTRLLLAKNVTDQSKKTTLFENVHWTNLKIGQPTDIGILTHLQQHYLNSGSSLQEQDILLILANRENYPQRQEALRLLTAISLKNSDWLISLKYHQALIKFIPEKEQETYLNVLNNLITLAEKTGRKSLLIQYLNTKLQLKNQFFTDTTRYQTFLRLSEILEAAGEYAEALNVSQKSIATIFNDPSFDKKYELYLSAGRFSEKLNDQQQASHLYEQAIINLPESLPDKALIALGIVQKILKLTAKNSPGAPEIDVLKRIYKYQTQLSLVKDTADTSLIIAQKFEKTGNMTEALRYYNQALEQYRTANIAPMVEKILIMLSNRKDGGLEGRKARLAELEQNQEQSNNWDGLIATRLELANFYQQENDSDQALIYFQKTLNTKASQKHLIKAESGLSAAAILSQQKHFEKSNEILNSLKQQIGLHLTPELNSKLFHRKAKNETAINQNKNAIKNINQALEYQVADQKYDILTTKGNILMQLKNFVEAEKLFEQQSMLNPLKSDVVKSKLNIVKSLMGRNEFKNAHDLIKRLEPDINQQDYVDDYILMLSLKSRIQYNIQLLNKALTTQEKLVKTIIEEEKTELQIPETLQLAKFYLLSGQPDQALKAANQLQNLLFENSQVQFNQQAIIAEVHSKQGNYIKALEIFKTIIEKSETIQVGLSFKAEIHYKSGFVHSHLLNFEAAVNHFEKAKHIYQKVNLTYEYFQAGIAKSMTIMKLGRFRETEQNLMQMLNDPKLPVTLKGEINNGLSKLYTDSGEFLKALQYSHQAESDYKSSNQKQQIAEMMNLRGMIYVATKDYQQANITFDAAMKLAKIQNHPLLESEIANNLGSLYLSLEKYTEARKWFFKTAEIQEKQNFEAGLAITYNNIAAVYLKEKKYSESLELLKDARIIAQKYNLLKEQAQGWNNEGLVYYQQKKLEPAQKAFTESKTLQQQLGQSLELSKTYNNLAMIAQQNLQLDEALKYIQEAIQWISINPLNPDELFPNPKVNDILAPGLMKNYLQNKGVFQRQISEQKSSVDKVRYLKGAFDSFKLSVNLTEIIRGQISGAESQQMLFSKNIDVFQQLIGTLYRLGQLDKISGYHELAYHYAEKSRSRSFLDQLQKQFSKVELEIPADIKKEELHLNNQIAQLEQNIFVELKKPEKERDDEKIKHWQLAKTKTLLAFKTLAKKLEQAFPAYAGAKYPISYDVKVTQSELISGNHLQLLSYFLGEDVSYGWAVGEKQFKMVKLAPQADFEKLIRKYRETLVNPLEFFDEYEDEMVDTTKTHTAIGIQIYRAIIEPLMFVDQFNVKDLIIIPDGILYYLPFEAIVKNVDPTQTDKYPDGREYLIHRYATHYSSSASVLGIIKQQRQLKMSNAATLSKNFIGFGDPQFNPDKVKINECQSSQKRGIGLKAKKKNKCLANGSKRGITLSKKSKTKKAMTASSTFEPNPTFEALNFYRLSRLINTERELEEISSVFKIPERSIYLQQNALESTAKKSLKDYQYIHFATHGILDEENPEYSGIMLNIVQPDQPEDGFLQSSEVFRLKLNADLVTLSACETGLGKVIKAEGMVGLTRSFLYAGASSIVVSLWSVADDSTANLMIDFYQNIMTGQTKVDALRKAKLDMMDEDYSDPFYWSPFVLNGMNN